MTGLYGIKPSRGRISRGPLDADSSGLSVLGPLARTVRDAAAFLDATAGPQPGDPYWAPPLPAGESFWQWCDRTPSRLRIGRYLQPPVPGAEVDQECRTAWEFASVLLESLGHEVVDIAMPLPAAVIPAFETVWAVSAASAPVPAGAPDRLRPLTRYLRERGARVSGPEYAAAVGMLNVISRQAVIATAGYDAVLTPTLALTPRPVGLVLRHGRRSGGPGRGLRAPEAVHPVHRRVQRQRPAGGQPAAALERRRVAGRRDAGRPAGGGGRAAGAVGATGGRRTVGGPAPGALAAPECFDTVCRLV